MLLLHAGVADSRMWDEQFQAWTAAHQVIRFDMRGFGRTMMPSMPFSHHQDAADLLDILGVDKACVIGASFGGYVALDLTLAYPERVNALILCAPAISGYEPSSEELQRFGEAEDAALERGDLEAAADLNVRTWVDGPHRTPEQVDPAVRERVYEMQLQVFANPEPEDVKYKELTPPAIQRLASIQVPTLVLVGELDVPEFVEMAGIVADGIPGAEKVVLPGVAHLPSIEQPSLFNRVVLEFLSQL